MYVLDSNVFIDAANAYYAFDLAPGYWDFLVRLFSSRHAVSIKQVLDELAQAGDEDPVRVWAKANKQHFVAPDARVLVSNRRVIGWATGQSYDQRAINEFQRVADSWIVAHALAYSWTVVTHEKPAPGAKKRVKIPDACAGVGVECMGPFDMLPQTGMKLLV